MLTPFVARDLFGLSRNSHIPRTNIGTNVRSEIALYPKRLAISPKMSGLMTEAALVAADIAALARGTSRGGIVRATVEIARGYTSP